MTDVRPVQSGDVIRVRDWPGTGRRRFVVRVVRADDLDALDDDQRLRSFPVEHCEVVKHG